MQDSRAKCGSIVQQRNQESTSANWFLVSKRSPMARVQSQPGPDTTGICSLCHLAFMGSFESSSRVRRQSVFTNFRVAYCYSFASCNCCHDPFIVRSAQTRPPFTGFTQLAQPSRCSRSTLTTVCFCARVSLSAAPSPNPSSARHRHLVVVEYQS